MGRGLAKRPRACDLHPHRPAVDRCDDCLRPFCPECLSRARETLRCRACCATLPARQAEAAARQRWTWRLRRALQDRLGGVLAGGLVLGVLGSAAGLALLSGATGGGSSAISQALADEPAVLQRSSAARYCSGGDGTTGNPGVAPAGGAPPTRGGPVLTAPTGALVAAMASYLPDTLLHDDRLAGTPIARSPFDPLNLIVYRGGYTAQPPGWRSQTGLFPQQVGFALVGNVPIERVAFQHTAAFPPESWVKEVSLLLSTEAADRGFSHVGRWTLAQTTAPQEFWFVETPARYARICLYANYGSREFVSLGALVLGVMPPKELMHTQSYPLVSRPRRALSREQRREQRW